MPSYSLYLGPSILRKPKGPQDISAGLRRRRSYPALGEYSPVPRRREAQAAPASGSVCAKGYVHWRFQQPEHAAQRENLFELLQADHRPIRAQNIDHHPGNIQGNEPADLQQSECLRYLFLFLQIEF